MKSADPEVAGRQTVIWRVIISSLWPQRGVSLASSTGEQGTFTTLRYQKAWAAKGFQWQEDRGRPHAIWWVDGIQAVYRHYRHKYTTSVQFCHLYGWILCFEPDITSTAWPPSSRFSMDCNQPHSISRLIDRGHLLISAFSNPMALQSPL
jgi:hypothetical protein